MQNLSAQLEAILFMKGEPESVEALAGLLNVSTDDITHALKELTGILSDRGLTIIEQDGKVQLATAPEYSELIEKLRREELSRDVGRAGAETLAIVLYKGPVTRSEIDYIRGVNSTFILRNLLVRGLVERMPNPSDQRSFLYKPTLDLLSYLGVTSRTDLPEYETVQKELKAFEERELHD